MIRTEKDILATLSAGAEWDAVALAEEVGICVKTVVRTLMKLQAAGIACVTRGGGRGRKTTVRIVDKSKARGTMSVFRRAHKDLAVKVAWPGEAAKDGEDCCDGWDRESAHEVDEYTPLTEIDAARADRARLMANTSWRTRPDWSRRVADAK